MTRPLLEVQSIDVRYGALQAISQVNLSVNSGEVVCILGSNGSGKSTVANAVAGSKGIAGGTIALEGREIQGLPAYQRVRQGISLVPERRRLFNNMSLLENLQLGTVTIPKSERRTRLDGILDMFPFFRERSSQKAGTFSGGEQQLISLARGLLTDPKLIIIDEPFLGLSPSARLRVSETISQLSKRHQIGVLFIEQNLRMSTAISDRVYILRSGRVVAQGPSSHFADEDAVKRVFLGLSPAQEPPQSGAVESSGQCSPTENAF